MEKSSNKNPGCPVKNQPHSYTILWNGTTDFEGEGLAAGQFLGYQADKIKVVLLTIWGELVTEELPHSEQQIHSFDFLQEARTRRAEDDRYFVSKANSTFVTNVF